MPLEQGRYPKVIGRNIAVEIRHGKSPRQAAAIAYSEAGRDDASLPGEQPPTRTFRFHTPLKLSDKMSETQEGFLICHDVCVARTGEMLYRGDEIENVQAGRDGIVRINRDAAVLFAPETIASFEGKPFTLDHPVEDVDPDNWSRLAKGHMQNVRQGTHGLEEFLLSDIVVADRDAISQIRSGGVREVSLGYDADYEQIEPGIGRQKNIVGNHVALVKRGRCGPTCSIRDRRPNMKISLRDALMRAFKTKDAAEVEELAKNVEMPEGESTHVHVHLNGENPEGEGKNAKDMKDTKDKRDSAAAEKAEGGSVEDRLSRIESLLEKLFDGAEGTADKKAGDAEGEKKDEKEGETKDESELLEGEEKKDDKKDEGTKDKTRDAESVMSDFSARAELLAPGVKMPRPTRDAMSDPKKMRDAVCLCKRRALDAAMKFDKSKAAIGKFLNTRDGATIKDMSCERVDAVFIGASELVRAENNAKLRAGGTGTQDSASTPSAYSSHGLDQIHQKFWAGQK